MIWQIRADYDGAPLGGVRPPELAHMARDVRWETGAGLERGYGVARPATLDVELEDREGRAAAVVGTHVVEGTPVRGYAFSALDHFSTPELSGGGYDLNGYQRTGGSRWTVSAAGGTGLRVFDGEVRVVVGGFPPSDARGIVNTGARYCPIVALFRRRTNGQGGLLFMCNQFGNTGMRLRFTHASTVLENIEPGTTTEVASGQPLDAGDWYEVLIRPTPTRCDVFVRNLEADDATLQNPIRAGAGYDAGREENVHAGIYGAFRNTADRWGRFGVGTQVFNGAVEAIERGLPRDGIKLTCVDVSEQPLGETIRNGLVGGTARVGDYFEWLNAQAGMLPAEYRIRTYGVGWRPSAFSWWGRTLGEGLRRLCDDSYGTVYADGVGRLRFLEWTGLIVEKTEAGRPTGRRIPYEGLPAVRVREFERLSDVEGSVAMAYRRSVDEGTSEFWSLEETFPIEPGESVEFIAESDGGDWTYLTGFAVKAGSLVANNAEDGTGTDLASDVTVEVGGTVRPGDGGLGAWVRVSFESTTETRAYISGLVIEASESWQPNRYTVVVREGDGDGPQFSTRIGMLDALRRVEEAADGRLEFTNRHRAAYEVEVEDRGPAPTLATVAMELATGWNAAGNGLGLPDQVLVEGLGYRDGRFVWRLREA